MTNLTPLALQQGETVSPFSSKVPNLQLAWDATSLGQYMFCPRSYQLAILQGWRDPGNPHLQFGGYVAKAKEIYRRARLNGTSYQAAQFETLRWLLGATWNKDTGPWSGRYESQWRCSGTEPYRNARGNKAKCPWSHAGRWFPPPSPDTCGTCGSRCEVQRRWVSDHPDKDRYALVRLIAWWLLDQPEDVNDGFHNIKIGEVDGVELSFTMLTPWKADTGESFMVAGHIDTVGALGDEHYIADDKTTKMWLGDNYWKQFAPNIQVDIYNLTGAIMWEALNIKGVLIEAAQSTIGDTKFGQRAFYQTEMQREELLMDLKMWLTWAEHSALADYWPMNRKNCFNCQFNKVCAAEPDKREAILRASFVKVFWNPLEIRT